MSVYLSMTVVDVHCVLYSESFIPKTIKVSFHPWNTELKTDASGC